MAPKEWREPDSRFLQLSWTGSGSPRVAGPRPRQDIDAIFRQPADVVNLRDWRERSHPQPQSTCLGTVPWQGGTSSRTTAGIRGIETTIDLRGDTIHIDLHKDITVDYGLADPRFDLSDRGGDRIGESGIDAA